MTIPRIEFQFVFSSSPPFWLGGRASFLGSLAEERRPLVVVFALNAT